MGGTPGRHGAHQLSPAQRRLGGDRRRGTFCRADRGCMAARRRGGRFWVLGVGLLGVGRLGRRRDRLCRSPAAGTGVAARRSRLGSHGAFIPVRKCLDYRHFCIFLWTGDWWSLVVAEGQPEEDLVGRGRGGGRGGCRQRRRRLCERYRQVGDCWRYGVGAFGPGASRRLVRVCGQAAFRRKGREPSHPRPRRADGSPRRVPCRRPCRPPDRNDSSRDGCAGSRLTDMVEPMKKKQPLARADLAPVPRIVTLLGATGSIGSSTVDLLRQEAARYQVEAVTAHRNAAALAKLARELGARFAAVADPDAYGELKAELSGSGIEAAAGPDAVVEAAERPADWVMAAITGATSLKPTLAAAERGASVALANKECLVCAGALFMRRAAAAGATVLPVDSEHNAIFQALGAGRREDVRRIVLTASGGPFRTWSLEAIRKVTVEQALKHPTWSMGPKGTIDSATLMNKGLELIKAIHLFALPPEELDFGVHPQSIVHGLVEFRDGSVIAQLGSPDMRIPISHCLAWPVRMGTPAARLNLAQVSTLSFEEPDMVRFPALAIARRALTTGGSAPTILNAANEVAVHEFVEKRLGFSGIPALVERTLDAMERRGGTKEPQTVEEAIAIDHNARRLAADLLPEIAAMAS